MATNITIPDASVRIAMEDGRPNTPWYSILSRLAALFNQATTALDNAETGLASKADKDQVVAAAFTFKFVEDETVRLIINCPFAWTITSTTTRTEAGTATCTFKIDGVALGGTANSASTSEQTQAHSSANVVDAGDDVEVTFSSTSGDCENLAITIAGTRVLD